MEMPRLLWRGTMTPIRIMEATSRALEDLEKRMAGSPKATPFHMVTVEPIHMSVFVPELRSQSRLTVEITLDLQDFRLLFIGQEVEIERTSRARNFSLCSPLGEHHQVCYRSREWLPGTITTTTTTL